MMGASGALGREIKHGLNALLIYAGLLAPLWILSDQYTLAAVIVHLELASVLSFYCYWRMTPWGTARYTSFGAALLIFAIVFRYLIIFDTLINGIDDQEWPSTLPIYGSLEQLFIRGEMITQLGFLLTIVAWRIAVAGALERLSLPRLAFRGVARLKLITLYGAALVITALNRADAVDFGGFAQLVGGVTFLGVAAIYLYASSFRSRWRRFGMAVVLALPLCLAAMNSGMKSEIFLPLVPSFMILWRNFSHIGARAVLVAAALGLFAIGGLYTNYVRTYIWKSGQQESPVQIAQAVYDSITAENFTKAMAGVMGRVNYAMAHAITMAVVDRDGFYFEEVYMPLPVIFIPRLLWPDKPAIQPGAAHTRRILGSSKDLSEMTSSTAAGLYAEMYLGGGYLVMMLSAIVYGALVGKLQLWVLRRLPALATALMAYFLFYQSLRFDEAAVLYVYNGIILFVVTLWLVMQVLYPGYRPGRPERLPGTHDASGRSLNRMRY